jgi:hypothetical protein
VSPFRDIDKHSEVAAHRLCIEIPRSGSRIFETGEEEFLKLDVGDGKLVPLNTMRTFLPEQHNHYIAPVIVVFTKFDLLFDHVEFDMDPAALDEMGEDKIRAVIEAEADKSFRRSCVDPLQKRINKEVVYAKVSSSFYPCCFLIIELIYMISHFSLAAQFQYRDQVSNLINITRDLVFRHVGGELWIIWAIAQRASIEAKIKGSIA